MSTLSHAGPVATTVAPASATAEARARRRLRAMRVTTVVTLVSTAVLVDLLVVGHTNGEEIWGVVTAALSAMTAAMSLTYLAVRGQSRVARLTLYALFATVALFGIGGYNDHRLPAPAGTVDGRERPPLAPLMFTGLGIVGSSALRFGTKGR